MKFFAADYRIARVQKRMLVASFVCLIWTFIALVLCWRGEIAPKDMTALASFNLGGVLLFHVIIRFGWSLRFRDIGMTQAQMIFAILCMCGIYILIPPARAATIQTMCLILVFGTFSLSAQQCLRMGTVLSVFPALTVFLLALAQPQSFSLSEDAVPALGASAILLIMARLLSHFCQLRQTLMDQRNELKALVPAIEILATTDELTGLYNRRRMAELAELALSRHARSKTPLCLVLLDIDYFKQVNDQYGHHIGDEVLIGVANALKAGLRSTDLLARWGGEEFIVVLPDADAKSTKIVLDRILDELRIKPLAHTKPDIRVTFSAGIAQRNSSESLQVLIEHADRAMYVAKESGRGQCVVDETGY
jgi:diguanylate cyclase (GGDEF)-like protein